MLILVLIVVSGMAVMSFGLSYRTRIEIQLSAACRYFGEAAGVKYAEPFAAEGVVCVKNVDFLI